MLLVFLIKIFQEYLFFVYCEDRVIEYYLKIKGFIWGQVVVQYMKIVEVLLIYGVYYYVVKDK